MDGWEPGGICGVVAEVRAHPEEVDADLQRFYGLSILEIGEPYLPWRRVGWLLRQLPPESALARAQSGGLPPWGTAEYLLRNILVMLGGRVVESPEERASSASRHHRLSAQLAEFHEESEARRALVGGGD